ncbi:3-phosphoshikimate 1-carboxyvinyltransferase 1 [uncultured Roseburia sp.]|uniref:3-phosphoshikimate 1-carboxyvinyltransferase n=1 Tax=Brotonthovivens ammoniilytica TaxID=2981725 RepID=A0ABT2TH96_9FIRM|nr:3-phosphoshikimate 1-carboxyvinyltransferase [Brotonthovivens ammoniilytica]MCU6761575.1 3-phosphoshikimate 1-carboxyvinyltransferase [Brotonthovivens ammoniilytica]SCI32446.1 3-phosphoshikimate 1-carboxyvinyltransferase 1 [uncultured Roseburia sp.]
MQITKTNALHGTVRVPGDKSISHRAIMFGAISHGLTEVTGFLQGADCLSTISCFQKMGIEIRNEKKKVMIYGKGLHGLSAPSSILDAGNSGTTTRLISGILAGQSFESIITGDASIQKRPMGRIFTPLSLMGAAFFSHHNNNCAPFTITGGSLKGIHYDSPVASAQVKSSILLAGLYADGKTSVTEPYLSRNHTELMLKGFGADITSENTTAVICPEPKLTGQKIQVPGDISSAAYFIAAGLMIPGSEILIENAGINPTRNGILTAAKRMGADISYLNQRTVSGEPVADLLITSCSLKAAEISGDLIPALIDEIPVIAVMAAFADGTTVIKDAQELKVKESDRIAAVTENLKAMGADVTPTDDGMIIRGGKPLCGTKINTYMDHRIAMAFAVAGMAAEGTTTFSDASCIDISYPEFFKDMASLVR